MPVERKLPRNPLPCGCGAKGIPDLACDVTFLRYKDIHVVHCPMHAAASDLYAALEWILNTTTQTNPPRRTRPCQTPTMPLLWWINQGWEQ